MNRKVNMIKMSVPEPADNFVVSPFITKVLMNKSLFLFGYGYLARDFNYAKNVLKATILTILKGDNFKTTPLGYDPLILNLVQKTIEIANSRPKIEFLGKRSGDVQHSLEDSTTSKLLGIHLCVHE